MILTDVRRVLQAAGGPASLGEIASRLDAHPEAVRAMLELWMDKGRVVRLPAVSGCGSQCRRCDADQTEYYLWSNESIASASPPPCPSA